MTTPPIPDRISREDARITLLAAQGIEDPYRRSPTKDGVLQAIRSMGQLQIDTIHVVARSPYLVLWTRLGDYEPRWLDELLADGAIFEAWSHEACFLPIEHYPYTRTWVDFPHTWKKGYFAFLDQHRADADQLLEHIRVNGEVRSADFANTSGNGGGWWDWKFEKRLLESLFTEGSLMVARREKFQRVYDLRERVNPSWNTSSPPSLPEMVRHHVLHSVKALGVASSGWVPDYYRLKVGNVSPMLNELEESGHLLVTTIEGVKGKAYIHPDNRELVRRVVAGEQGAERTTLLSPFDPVVWDRRRGVELFDFFYRIECYTPEARRQYGYFSLPILHRGSLVGRLDAKAHRRDQVFEVRSLHLEPGVEPGEELASELARALRDCARWHRTPNVVIRKSNPRGFARVVRQGLKSGS